MEQGAEGVRRLNRDERRQVIDLMMKGASPQGACLSLQIPLQNFLRTVEQSPSFVRRVQGVFQILSANVVAALYQSAMKGTTTAQGLWLKTYPLPEWLAKTNGNELLDLEQMDDAQLEKLARQRGSPGEFGEPGGESAA